MLDQKSKSIRLDISKILYNIPSILYKKYTREEIYRYEDFMTKNLSEGALNFLLERKRKSPFNKICKEVNDKVNAEICKNLGELKYQRDKEKYKEEIRNYLLDEFLDSFNFKE